MANWQLKKSNERKETEKKRTFLKNLELLNFGKNFCITFISLENLINNFHFRI